MKTKDTTPMMQQWHQCKAEAKDALVFFRLGDFYEAFHDDAVTMAKAIDLTLTKRQDIPMCGVPVHTAELYLDKLVAKGFKIAIAEQMEDPRKTKGIVKRGIVRFVSPGTLVSSELLDEKANNFFISLSQVGGVFGITIIDLTTSEFRVMEIEDKQSLLAEIYRLKPAELLASKRFCESHDDLLEDLKLEFTFVLNRMDNELFEGSKAASALTEHFTGTLEDLNLQGMTALISSAGALLHYLKKDLKINLTHVKKILNEKLSGYMSIDRTTFSNLDLLGNSKTDLSLLKILDKTETPMGARLLTNWMLHPLLSSGKIQDRQDAVEELTRNVDILMDLRALLSDVRDLERLIMKVQSGYSSPRDMGSLKNSLEKVPFIKEVISQLNSSSFEKARNLLEDPAPLTDLIGNAIVDTPPLRLHDGRVFREGYHQELDELYQIAQGSKEWIANYQQRLRQELGIKNLKVGYTRVFGYYIDVTSSQSSKVPGSFQRKQTLVNSERFITDELKHFEHKALSAEERIKAHTASLFEELRKKVSEFDALVHNISRALSAIDVFFSLATVALENNYVRPEVSEDDILEIKDGRHPIIEKGTALSDFIPNDTLLNEKERLYLITGPNMAGKSTYIRQVALLVIMAQMGSFIPAASAKIGIVDKVFSRVGASDDLARGQSTFMVEMSQTAHILNSATSRSLVILDEIGRGTSTYDGISIAWAVAEYLLTTKDKRTKTLFATHYWELTELEEKVPGAVNYQVAVQETDEGIVFLRKIIKGGTDKSYGIHVAKLAGLPFSCIKKAESMLLSLEKENRGKPKKKQTEQLPLFSQKSQVEDEISKIDVNKLSPIEALNTLFKLQQKL